MFLYYYFLYHDLKSFSNNIFSYMHNICNLIAQCHNDEYLNEIWDFFDKNLIDINPLIKRKELIRDRGNLLLLFDIFKNWKIFYYGYSSECICNVCSIKYPVTLKLVMPYIIVNNKNIKNII